MLFYSQLVSLYMSQIVCQLEVIDKKIAESDRKIASLEAIFFLPNNPRALPFRREMENLVGKKQVKSPVNLLFCVNFNNLSILL